MEEKGTGAQGDLFLTRDIRAEEARTRELEAMQHGAGQRNKGRASAKVCLRCLSYLPEGTTWKMGCPACPGYWGVVSAESARCPECLAAVGKGDRRCRACKAAPIMPFSPRDMPRAAAVAKRYALRTINAREAGQVEEAARERGIGPKVETEGGGKGG